MEATDSPYDVLGVREGADRDEIDRAYKRKLRELHPDRATDDRDRAVRDQLCRQLGEAYHSLTDPRSRRVREGAPSHNNATDQGEPADGDRGGKGGDGDTGSATDPTHDPSAHAGPDPFADGWVHESFHPRPGTSGAGSATPAVISLGTAALLGAVTVGTQMLLRASGLLDLLSPENEGWFVPETRADLAELSMQPRFVTVALIVGAVLGLVLFATGKRSTSKSGVVKTLVGLSMLLLVAEYIILLFFYVAAIAIALAVLGLLGILVNLFSD